ncbi:hypothetical protein ASE82_14735 [Sphingomonas sp. Leaf230]|uniref:AAA family ATPase n=1 Tax=Sphingomonas sp. Leaf230 TaxID=1735694 RepID=UPI0006F8EE55|nr:AAA family ATPase [Sphingomonas sp. Leaf230]KQN01690.1 hypothetical protein ASE82_14735 [Sphingomonas sp. Leaf230]
MNEEERQELDELLPWISQSVEGHWQATAAMDQHETTNDYLIEGILPRTGASVWFGAGSTGKTQVLIWMATAIAASRSDVPEWLGHAIRGTGHVLILSAEDTREQLFMRLRSVLTEMHGFSDQIAREVCSRIHVMPFVSMTEKEFDRPNPSLFAAAGAWGPSETMKAIRVFITQWNDAARRPEDRIVGVIMDSATSMAGFDANAADAVTNFFFYVNRLCQALGIFWIIIGHTPKVQKIDHTNPDADAAARLRGVALWTTAPRTTVEVRLALGPRARGGQPGRNRKPTPFEAKPVIDAGFAANADDVIVLRLAKSNLHDSYRGKHFLVRRPGGLLEYVTDDLSPVDVEAASDDADEDATAPVVTLAEGTRAVWHLICELTGGEVGAAVSADKISRKLKTCAGTIPHLASVKFAGTDNGSPREGAANWHLKRLFELNLLVRHKRAYAIAADAAAIAEAVWADELNTAR